MRLRKTVMPACLVVFAGLLAALFPAPGAAIVGGGPDAALAASAVMVLKSNGGVCSGVVVAPDVVLTAAHCATGTDQYRIHYRGRDGAPVMLEPAARKVHPDYKANAVKARKPSVDLALFHLKEPLPPPFARAVLSARHPDEGTAVTIGGYGFSTTGDVGSMGTFHAASLAVREPYGAGRLLIWVRGDTGAQICTGDSGGPLVYDGAVFAVTAWANIGRISHCGPSSQGVLLGPQRRWIDAVLDGWGSKAAWRD